MESSPLMVRRKNIMVTSKKDQNMNYSLLFRISIDDIMCYVDFYILYIYQLHNVVSFFCRSILYNFPRSAAHGTFYGLH